MNQMSTETLNNDRHFPLISNELIANQKLEDLRELYNESYPVDNKNVFCAEANLQLLRAVFSNSPYLTRLIFKFPTFAFSLFDKPADVAVEEVYAELEENLSNGPGFNQITSELRIAKAKLALAVAFADLTGEWNLTKITRSLSEFAEYTVKMSVDYLLKEAIEKEELQHDFTANVSENSGYVVLGLGKLGGYELNYSSDIDLIVLFDLDIVKYSGKRSAQDFFIKLTQKLVKIMSDRTSDGYVFRTDLRLRPDPGATPVALSMEGAEVYYQSVGLNWERAAMIKARPIAGDIRAGYGFLDRIRGFVWRKHLDYAAIDDIHAIKKLIHQHHHHSHIKLEGHDIKLGRGGIREIEFFAQIHQLISGGREPFLRIAPTRLALNALCENGKLDKDENITLQTAYVYFRTLEHRLQMVNDDQTHEIPTSDAEIERITRFMGYSSRSEFENDLMNHLNNVHELFNNLLHDTNQTEKDESLSFPLDSYHPATLEAIESAGFSDAKKTYEIIQNWQIGRYRACRTQRARTILKQLVPEILKAFGRHENPDGSLVKFDDFLSRLPSGIQLFSFIKAQPWLLELLAQITGIAPYLSNQLSRNPLLLDSMISADIFRNNSDPENLKASLNEQLKTAMDFQDILDITRKWANEGKFQVGLQILRGSEDIAKIGETLTFIAEVSLNALLQHVKKEFSQKHGVIENSSLCILAMGKLGGYELTTTSDIDMVLIYDAKDMSAMSNGEKKLSVNHYYARLCQNFINSITALTGEGKLYEVDVRLRPSGTAGPIAVSIESFSEYQKGQAWVWEHMALTRARVISENNKLGQTVTQTIQNILRDKNRSGDFLLREVAMMRQRLWDNYKTENIWAIKHVRGGLIDVEFICQYLLLKHGAEHEEILVKNTLHQISELKKKEILTETEGTLLYKACHTLQTIQAMLRLCLGSTSKMDEMSPALLNALAERLDINPDQIENLAKEQQKLVFDLYNQIIGFPAQKLIPEETEKR